MEVSESGHDESIMDLTSTSDVQSMGSDEEEYGKGDGDALNPVSRCVSHVLTYLAGDRCWPSEMDTTARYIILINDIWKMQDWTKVKRAFPDNNNGSRIIATTRITGVANMCCSNFGDQLYQMSPLDDDHSRRLFLKRIFQSDDFCPTELEEVSTRILKKCGGLPLAIITFASLLANKASHKDVWERLEYSIGTGSLLDDDGNLKVMKDILLLSYWDLPHCLKPCLLYLCIYPEDCKISCDKLKWKWMAEGLIATQQGYSDKQVADYYLNELVNRNMIQPVGVKEYDGSVKEIRVHDMVLDIIISQSHDENFAIVLNGPKCNSFPSKIRRLSMQSSGKEHNEAVRVLTETKAHVRSLTIFEGIEQMPRIVDFHALRVLDLNGRGLENKHVKHIGSSRQLRYLRIGSNGITELPSGIGELQQLETLNLRGCYSLRTLPSTVTLLQKLVRLFVSISTQLPATGFRSLQALEELTFQKTDDPDRFAEELNELGKCNLRYLDIHGEIAERLFCNPCCTCPCLQVLKIWEPTTAVRRGMVSLENVVKLNIAVKIFDQEGFQVLMGLASLSHLRLHIIGAIKEKLTVGSNGFKLLKVFRFLCSQTHWFRSEDELTGGRRVTLGDELRLTFAPGAVPALRLLGLMVSPMGVTSDFIADLGVEHLPGLAHLDVQIHCFRAVRGRVEAMESSVEKAINLHPKREICVRRFQEDFMLKDEKEWEDLLKERKECFICSVS